MRFANLNLTSYVIGSEDGELSCGYSSFRGKRVTMEDFYDVKSTTIDGQRVCMFGIFDGYILSLFFRLLKLSNYFCFA